MRAAIGLPVADLPNVWADSATAHFERAEQLWDEYKSNPWVCLYFAPQDANEVGTGELPAFLGGVDGLLAAGEFGLGTHAFDGRDQFAGERSLVRRSAGLET